MLGEQIRKLRRDKKLTQGQLGDILNVSHGTIGMWETNNRAQMLLCCRNWHLFLKCQWNI